MNSSLEATLVPQEIAEMVASAMSTARASQTRWAATPVVRRLELVRQLRHLIAEQALQLAEASARARGRPALESLTAEVLPLAEACRFLEREAPRILATRRLGKRGLPLWLAGVETEIRREPFGVVLIIGPGNYPLLLPGAQLIQALVAGNAVLLKPGSGGTAAARMLCDLILRAGFDPALVALLPETPEAARRAILARPDKVIFTGSAATGEKILAQLAPQLIPATMELSGCDAVIVRGDADLDLAVKALTFGLLLNDGATCMAPKRAFVHRSIATELEGRLASSLPPGNPRTRPARAASNHLSLLLDQAIASGAHFVCGGISAYDHPRLPIILAGVPHSARLLREDVFAPVLAILTVSDDTEAIARANDCPYALAASIFTRDESAARKMSGSLNAGVVTINDLIVPTADARIPFGGRQRSGFGVTRGAEGLLELTTAKVVTVSRGKFRPAFEPPQPGDEAMFQACLKLTHGRGFCGRIQALAALVRSLANRTQSKKGPQK